MFSQNQLNLIAFPQKKVTSLKFKACLGCTIMNLSLENQSCEPKIERFSESNWKKEIHCSKQRITVD